MQSVPFTSKIIVLLFVSLLDIQLHVSIGVRVKASFNDISAISWRSVLLVGERRDRMLVEFTTTYAISAFHL
jgi:hypothetical protein